MELEEVKIELTSYCKRKCIHCSSNGDIDNTLELSLSKVKELIDECSILNVKSIVLTGGEATEYKDLAEVVGYIKSKNINNIKLYTMCDVTSEKMNLIKQLQKLGLTEVVYSLTIPLTTDNALNFNNVASFLADISKFIDVSIHYCLTTKTLNDVDKLPFIINKLTNFKQLSFLRYVEHGRGTDSLTVSYKQLLELKKTLLTFIKIYPNKIRLGSPFNILNITYSPCNAGSNTLIIGVDGKVYPCDAMKYFSYLGSGGNIYQNTLQEIYNSEYFKEIRIASKIISEECRKCSNEKCLSGCLGQKMLNIIKKDNQITTSWYQENALRTINNFGSLEYLKFNAYMGISGESGEFFDYMKKLYTHNLSTDKKEEIIKLAPNELGDVVWYLSSSLAIYYNYSLTDVYNYIMKNYNNKYSINSSLIKVASTKKDPLCPYTNSNSYSIDLINEYIVPFSDEQNSNVFLIFMEFKRILNQIDYVDSREEIIRIVAEIVLFIARISKYLFNKNLSEILNSNIEKLRDRYPEGFDEKVANRLVDFNSKYREEQKMKVKK